MVCGKLRATMAGGGMSDTKKDGDEWYVHGAPSGTRQLTGRMVGHGRISVISGEGRMSGGSEK